MLHSAAVLTHHIFDNYWTFSVLVKIYKKYSGGLKALIKCMADAPNATAPCA